MFSVIHCPLESELTKSHTIIWSNIAPINKTVAFLRMVAPRKQNLSVHALVFSWTLYERNVQKRLLKIALASWTALVLQTPTDRTRLYCSVMKRHFQRNLHPHTFSCHQNLLVNRSPLPDIASGSLGLLITPLFSWNARENGGSACLFCLMSTTALKQSKPSIIFGLLTVKQACCLIITCTRYQNTRFTSESPAIFLRSGMMEVKGADSPVPLTAWSPGSTEWHGVSWDQYEQKMRAAPLLWLEAIS